jgi:hypothetical protein
MPAIGIALLVLIVVLTASCFGWSRDRVFIVQGLSFMRVVSPSSAPGEPASANGRHRLRARRAPIYCVGLIGARLTCAKKFGDAIF